MVLFSGFPQKASYQLDVIHTYILINLFIPNRCETLWDFGCTTNKLPYLQAIVKETLRLHPAAPFLVPHKAITEAKIHGFTIPKDAQVLVNVWVMVGDPNIWENPNTFTPERFLGWDIDVRGNNFELILFGYGRQISPGLPLATRMIHLMLGSLFHFLIGCLKMESHQRTLKWKKSLASPYKRLSHCVLFLSMCKIVALVDLRPRRVLIRHYKVLIVLLRNIRPIMVFYDMALVFYET